MVRTASTHENLLNSELARYLRRQGLDAFEEQVVRDSNNRQHIIDVLVNLDEFAVAIEAEYAPQDGRSDAEKRLTSPPLIWQGLPILFVYAVSYPNELKEMAPDEAFSALVASKKIIYSQRYNVSTAFGNQVSDSIDGIWSLATVGGIAEIAEALHNYWVQTEKGTGIDKTVQLVSKAIEDASEIIAQQPQIGEKDSDPASTKALIWLNALLFQEMLSRYLDTSTLDEKFRDELIPRPDPDLGAKHLIEQWQDILRINWWPIFEVARESLKQTPSPIDNYAINILKRAAAEIAEQGAIRRHDIAGRIFHRLLDTRKFLATNYTTIPAAIMLAGLALDGHHPKWKGFDFGDLEAISKLKIVDPACGSGTLLMAVVQEILKHTRRNNLHSHEQMKVSKSLLEKVVWGFDVVPAAVHLAASTLAMSETRQLIDKMNLWRMKYGIYWGMARLGSLDFLDTSDTLGNAARLPLVDDTDATRAHGYGEVEEAISFPKNCDLIIANPPYTRAGSPGDRANTDWNPIFGSMLDEEDQKRMNAALKRTLKGVEASLLAGLGSAFVVLANQKIAQGGRIAFVLPTAALTGSSWKRIRQLLLDQFEIDWVIASHDSQVRSSRGGLPGRIFTSFSESTKISETLIVATKRTHLNENHVVRFVNLRCNPVQIIDALAVTRNLLSHGDSGSQEIVIGEKVWGEIVCAQQRKLGTSSWLHTAFIQSKLIEFANQLTCNGSFREEHIPLIELADQWDFGPYEMQIKSPKQGIFDISEGFDALRAGEPALWHHKAAQISTMNVSANAQLQPRPGLAEHQSLMLKKAGKLQFARELRFNTQKLGAVVTDRKMLGVRSWFTLNPKEGREGVEQCMCLWLNSTPGLFLRMIQANRPYPGRTLITHTSALDHLVLDLNSVPKKRLLEGKKAFEKIKKKKLLRVSKMDTDSVRQNIDAAVCDLIGIADRNHFASISVALVNETLVNPSI